MILQRIKAVYQSYSDYPLRKYQFYIIMLWEGVGCSIIITDVHYAVIAIHGLPRVTSLIILHQYPFVPPPRGIVWIIHVYQVVSKTGVDLAHSTRPFETHTIWGQWKKSSITDGLSKLATIRFGVGCVFLYFEAITNPHGLGFAFSGRIIRVGFLRSFWRGHQDICEARGSIVWSQVELFARNRHCHIILSRSCLVAMGSNKHSKIVTIDLRILITGY